MSAILPPAERLWYKHPIDRVEGTWIVIALTWCLIMFFMMVGWHIWGKQNLSTETYRTTPEMFMAKTQAMVDKYTVRTESDENATPVVMNTCYSFVTARDVIHVASVHQYDAADKTFKTVPGSGGVSAAANQIEGRYALSWADNIWHDMLG